MGLLGNRRDVANHADRQGWRVEAEQEEHQCEGDSRQRGGSQYGQNEKREGKE